MATRRAYKAVTADLKSPFLPWNFNPFSRDPRITYSVGGTFAAAGIEAIAGYWYRVDTNNDGDATGPEDIVVLVEPPDPPVDIRDRSNRYRGILACPSLDSFWLRPFGNDPVEGARYLQLEYDDADVLGVGTARIGAIYFPDGLSLASVTVVAEVFP